MAYSTFVPPQWGVDSPFAMIPGALPAVTANRANPTLLGSAQQVGMPNPFGDLSAVYPNLGKSNAATSALILSQLAGELSPETQRAIQDAAARYGVTSGMAGGGLTRNRTARDLGRSSQDIQQQGLQNYNSILPMISRTQTVDPSLQAQINTRNANATDDFAVRNAGFQNQFALANQDNERAYDFQNVNIAGINSINAAAPNPGRAAAEAQRLFDEYLQKTQTQPNLGATGGYNITTPSGPAGGSSFDRDGRYNAMPPGYTIGADGRGSFDPNFGLGTGVPQQQGEFGNQNPNNWRNPLYTASLPLKTGTYSDAELNMLQGLTNEDIQSRVWQNPAGFNYFGTGQPSSLWDLPSIPDTSQNNIVGMGLTVGGYDPWQDYIDATGG